jgi:DNA polymerase bacteriophage-type
MTRLVAGDYAGIEARIVLSLAGQHDKTKLIADGVDIYIDMAESIYGVKGLTKQANPEERQTGKNSVLGLGFQMGAKKFYDRYGSGQTLEFCQTVVDTYRTKWAPQVPKLWRGLGEASTSAVWSDGQQAFEAFGVVYRLDDMWLTAALPSGRKLWYVKPTRVMRAMPWDPDDIRRGWHYVARKGGTMRPVAAFGGSLAENAVQALSRDILCGAMKRLDRWRRAGATLTAAQLEEVMGDVEPWVRQMQVPIAVETWEGDRYRK